MANCYLRTNGNDANNGTTDALAVKTLARAEALATTAGNIIYVANGFNSIGEKATAPESITYRAYRSTVEPSDVPPVINAALDIIGETWTNVVGTERVYFDLTAGSGHANDNIAYLRFKCYALQIQYAGAAATATAAITSTGVTLTTTTPAATHTFTFENYPTLGLLVTAMNALTGWTCTRPFMASDYPSSGLAAATHADVKTEAVRFAWTPGAAGSGYIGGKKVTTPAVLGEYSIATDGAAGTRVTIYVTDGSDEDPTQDFVAVEVFWSDHAVNAGAYNVTLDGLTLRGFGGYTATQAVVGTGNLYIHNCIIVHEAKIAHSETVRPLAARLTANSPNVLEAHNNTVIGGYAGFALVGTGTIRACNNLFIGQFYYPLWNVGAGVVVHGDNRVYGWYGYLGKTSIALSGGTDTALGGDTWDDDPRKLALSADGWEWPAGMANISLHQVEPYQDIFAQALQAQTIAGKDAPLAIGFMPSGEGWDLNTMADKAAAQVQAGSELVNSSMTRQIYVGTNEGLAGTLTEEAFTLTTTKGTTSATCAIDQTAGTFTTTIDGNPDLNIDITTGGVLAGHYKAIDGYMTIAELIATINLDTQYTATINARNTTYSEGRASCACLADNSGSPEDISFDSIDLYYTGTPAGEVSKAGDDITIAFTDVPVMSVEYTGTASAAELDIAANVLTTTVTAEEVFEIQCTAATSNASAATMTKAGTALTTEVTEAEAFDIAYAGAATTMTMTKAAGSLQLDATADAMDLQYAGAATTADLTIAANTLTVDLTADVMDLQYVGAATTAVMDIAANHLTVDITGDAMDMQYVGAATTCDLDIAGTSLTTTATCDAMTLTYVGGGAACVADYTPGGNLTTTVTTADAFDVQYVGAGTGCTLDIVAGTSLTTTMSGCPALDIDYTGAAVAGTVTVGGGFIRGDTTGSVDDFFFSFVDCPTLQDVVDAISALANWTAALNTEGRATWASNTLDLAGLVDAKGATAVMDWSGVDLNFDLTAAAYDTVAELVAEIDDAAVRYTATITHADYNNWDSVSLDAVAAQDIQAGAHTATYSGVDLDLDLADAANDTIAELCAVIHAKNDYTCVIGDAEFNDWLSADLDNLVAQDVINGAAGHVCTWTGLDLNIDLTNAATDSFVELVAVIDALAGYTCTIGDAEFNAWASTNLDSVVAQDLIAAPYTCTFAGTDVDLDLTDVAYDTILEVVTVLDALAGYTCTIGAAEFNPWNAAGLDAVATQDLIAAPYTCAWTGNYILDLTNALYDTVGEVVTVLHALTGFTCTIGDAEFSTWASTSLDAVAAQDLIAAPYTCTWAGTPHTYNLANAANDTIQEIVAILHALTGVTCTIGHADYNAWPSDSLVAVAAQDITGAGHAALWTGTDLSYDLTLAANDTIAEIVALINAKADYTCTIASANFNTRDTADLDAVASQDILTAAYDATWSGTDLTYDLTDAASDTITEVAALINARAFYTSASLHADYDSLDSDTLNAVAALDITSSRNLGVSGVTYTYDTTNVSYDTYDKLVAAIDGSHAGALLAIVTPGTVGGDPSADLADFTAVTMGGTTTLSTPAGSINFDLTNLFLSEFVVTKDWLTTNAPGSHGEIVIWPLDWYNNLKATPRAALASEAEANDFTLGRAYLMTESTASSYIDFANGYEGGHNIYQVRGSGMTATTPQAADDHVKHFLTWARVNGFPISFTRYFLADLTEPNMSVLDGYVKAIKKYGRYASFSQMLAHLSGTVRTYERGRADSNKILVPAPQAFSSLIGNGRIIAGVHAASGHVDAIAQTYPRLQAQAFGFRSGGETEWSAQRKLAFFIDTTRTIESITIDKWGLTLSDSAPGGLSFATYPTIGSLIAALLALAPGWTVTVQTHVQCIRSLPSTHLEQTSTLMGTGKWIHFYPEEIQPSIGAIEHVVKLGQPKEHWRR